MIAREIACRLLGATVLVVCGACGQEKRTFREAPPAGGALDVRQGELQPGPVFVAESTKSPYGTNAYAIGEGQRLYNQMNCVGCHFHGGGGIGPALMDETWIYGSDPSQIFRTIVEGRPNGMPSFKDKLTNQEVWELVAYVRSLSGLGGASTVSSAREDHMYLSPDLGLRSAEKPKGKTIP